MALEFQIPNLITVLPPPVMLSPATVCLSVTGLSETTDQILVKFCGMGGHNTGTDRLDSDQRSRSHEVMNAGLKIEVNGHRVTIR